MSNTLLASSSCLLLDGGLATELERRGADLGDALWSARLLMDDPALIQAVHESYFSAGADVATSASYQASLAGFARRGLTEGEALGLMGRSVELARAARAAQPDDGRHRLVAGSVGPYGAALADGSEYRGGYAVGPGALRQFHRPRLEVLLDAGADLLAIETMPSVAEVAVVLELLAGWPNARAWVSFTCRNERETAEGQPVADAARVASDSPQVVAVGVNCVAPALVDGLLARFHDATDLPLVAYPNSGEVWDAMSRRWVGGVGELAPQRDLPRWRALGARLIGGCCRVGPEAIREMRRAIDEPEVRRD